MEIKQLLNDYLQEARLMQIATSVDNQPWVCTVYFAFDQNLQLYWISTVARRHSQEIEKNSKVAGVIVVPHTPGEKVRGIQFQGTAQKATPEELTKAIEVYGNRMGWDEERKKRMQTGESSRAIYIIKPTCFVLYDEVNFPDNPRQEYNLA